MAFAFVVNNNYKIIEIENKYIIDYLQFSNVL